MKKLMIVLGAALMCSAASAAQVLWYTSETFQDASGVSYTQATSPMAYLFDAATVTQGDLFDSWKGGSTSLSSAIASASWYDAYEYDITSVAGSGTKTFYWAVVEGKDLFISSTQSQGISDVGATYFNWGSLDESKSVYKDAASFGNAGWYTAVPEPTSGLLLLLGMAGLALRRRRA